MSVNTIVLGAEPSGLSAAHSLAKRGQLLTVIEPTAHIGGFARSENYQTLEGQSYCVDLGGGGFNVQPDRVFDAAWMLWQELMVDDVVVVEVRSRIHYHHRLFDYPLSFTNAIKHMGPTDFFLTGLSYLKSRLALQQQQPATFPTAQDWTQQHFGRRLSRQFFEPYLQKVWGLSAAQLTYDCGQQCIDSTLMKEALSTLASGQTARTVYYPKTGSGTVWENCKTMIEQMGATVSLNTKIVEIEHKKEQIERVVVEENGYLRSLPVDNLISSLSLLELVRCMNAPQPVISAAEQLQYRHLVNVALVVDMPNLFDEQWIYVQQPNVQVSRIQNFKNWSPNMVPDADKTCLGLSYLCSTDDAMWDMDSDALVQMASAELVSLGLVLDAEQIESGTVLRQPQAYPVRTLQSVTFEGIVQDYLDGFENLQSIGRKGTHQMNQLAEEMLSGLMSARTLLGEKYNERQRSEPVLQSLQAIF